MPTELTEEKITTAMVKADAHVCVGNDRGVTLGSVFLEIEKRITNRRKP